MPRLTLDRALETFVDRFSTSAEWTRQGKDLIPGGYSRNSFNFGPHAIYVESGEGAHITTVDGHRLLDLNNNFTVNVLGHNHPGIHQAVIDAMATGMSFGNPSAAEPELAQILIDRIPSVERVQFSCSSTESCMSAVRIARAHTGRHRIAKFEGGYHGFSDALHISVHPDPSRPCGEDEAPQPLPDSAGIPQSAVDEVVLLVQNDWDSCERILRAHGGELACVIMELESGAGGLVVLERDFVQRLRDLTRELGMVLIFDETITLRADYRGLQGVYGVTPDLTVMGKMIGGGMPLGAVGGSAEVMGELGAGGVSISGTHHGHKLALTAGAACMNQMTEDAFEWLNSRSQSIMGRMNTWAEERAFPFHIYGVGYSHLAYAFVHSPELRIRTHRDYWRHLDAEKTQACSIELANRGYFPVHRGEFSLSLAMSDADIDGFVATLQQIVADLIED